jgi:hypothetical protein
LPGESEWRGLEIHGRFVRVMDQLSKRHRPVPVELRIFICRLAD